MIRTTKSSLIIASHFWIILLLVLSMQPEAFVMLILRAEAIYPLAHVTAYAILGFLLCLSFRFKGRIFALRLNEPLIFLCSFAAAFLCGGATEAVQIFSPDRIPDWQDFSCDLTGAFLGVLMYAFLMQSRRFLRMLKPADSAKSSAI